MHASDRVFADRPHRGGFIWIAADQLASNSANLALTRNGAFDWSLNRVAAGAEPYIVMASLTSLRRIVEPMDSDTWQLPAQAQPPTDAVGRPPFTGYTQFATQTGQPAKSIVVRDVFAVYQVGVVALTVAALAHQEIKYANNAANVLTNFPLDATALPLAVQANPYLVTRAVTNPVTVVDDTSDLEVEFSFTLAITGTVRVYGIGVHCDFNFN
jgi:hypothetical protein